MKTRKELKMKIKIFSIILTFILCLTAVSLLAACQNTGIEAGTSASTSTSAEGETREEETLPPPMEEADGDDLSYVLVDGNQSYAVLGLFNESGAKKIIIPAEYNGLPVTAISENAFQSSDALETLIIPDSVTHIGSYAFDGCTNLKNLELSSNLTYLGSAAFDGCDSLPLSTYDNALYIGDSDDPYAILVSATDTEIESCTIHASTKIIYDGAFFDCSDLEELIIPDGLIQIGYVFYDCHDLFPNNDYEGAYYLGNEENPFLVLVEARGNPTSIKVHEDTKLIAPYAFENCDELTDLTLPDGLRFIGIDAFVGCELLAEVTVSTAEWTLINGEYISKPVLFSTGDSDLVEVLKSGACTWMKK